MAVYPFTPLPPDTNSIVILVPSKLAMLPPVVTAVTATATAVAAAAIATAAAPASPSRYFFLSNYTPLIHRDEAVAVLRLRVFFISCNRNDLRGYHGITSCASCVSLVQKD